MSTCTHGPSAVTGARCGKPAVTSFVATSGETFHECAEHAPKHPFAPDDADHVMVWRYGREYVGKIVKRGKRGAVYAEIRYGNGTKRIVRVEV